MAAISSGSTPCRSNETLFLFERREQDASAQGAHETPQPHRPVVGYSCALSAGARGVGHVNINQAGVASLSLLPGVGPKRAEAIIRLRQKRPFRRAIQLRRVRGIGRRTLLKMLPYVRVMGSPTSG